LYISNLIESLAIFSNYFLNADSQGFWGFSTGTTGTDERFNFFGGLILLPHVIMPFYELKKNLALFLAYLIIHDRSNQLECFIFGKLLFAHNSGCREVIYQ
jgi:hypothetical protein